MNDNTILGETLGQLGQTAKKTGQQIVRLPEEMSKDVGEQVGGAKNPPAGEEKKEEQKSGWKSDEERVKFLKGLYGSTEFSSSPQIGKKPDAQQKQTSSNPLVTSGQDKQQSEFQKQIANKSPEEQKKLMELRNQLHKENYYDPTFNSVKKQEERPAEKVENEKKQEMADLQKKEEKKPPPLAVVREQNKAEQFRGVSG